MQRPGAPAAQGGGDVLHPSVPPRLSTCQLFSFSRFSIKTQTDVNYKNIFLFAKEAVSSLVVAYPAMHNGYVYIIYIYNHRKIWIFSCVHFSQKKQNNPKQQTHQVHVSCEIFPTSFNLQQRNINVGHLTPEKVPPPDLAP